MLFGTSLIVFRETLEAALFVGIVAAATRHLAQRGRWLVLGIAAGTAGSLAVAASIERIASGFDGMGQDLLSATLLTVALSLLAWHAVDAPRHARNARHDARRLGTAATADARSMLALSGAVALAVLREGAETVLFVMGSVGGGAVRTEDVVLSVGVGLSLGVAAGGLLYLGLGRIQPKPLFAITHVLILLLAGALASQLALTLGQANWLTLLGDKAWDLSQVLPNNSVLGTLLHGVLGYDASPTQAQVLAYTATVLLIAAGARGSQRRLARTVRGAPDRLAPMPPEPLGRPYVPHEERRLP